MQVSKYVCIINIDAPVRPKNPKPLSRLSIFYYGYMKP